MELNSFSLLVSRNSTLKKVSRTSLRDAKTAETLAKLAKKLREKCSLLFAQAAAKKLKFLSDQEKTAQYTAASALLK